MPSLIADLDPGVGQHVLDAGARHRAGGEGVAFDNDRILREHGLDIQCLQLVAIERVEIGEARRRGCAAAVAEIVLAAGVKAQILAHLRPPRFEKPDQPAVMIKMPVAEDQRIHRGRVDFQQFELLVPCRGGKPDALHGEAGAFERPEEDVVRVVGDLSYDDPIDPGRRYAGIARADRVEPLPAARPVAYSSPAG